jgi:FkbM family methyltransferase
MNNFTHSKAQLFQDLWVLYELGEDVRGGYFVEIGATDGEFLSNTFLLEKHFDWKGALCEPNPVWHPALYRNRAGFISPKCMAAVSGEIVEFAQTPAPEFSAIASYKDLDHNARFRQDSVSISCETISLSDFLVQAASPQTIDFLSIDTEGNEYEILSTFDFTQCNVRLIAVEHNFTDNRQKLFKMLTDHGFVRRFEELSRWDDWYCSKELAEQPRRAGGDRVPRGTRTESAPSRRADPFSTRASWLGFGSGGRAEPIRGPMHRS